MNIKEHIKTSGMYKITYQERNDEEDSVIIFVSGVNPFLVIENFVWCVEKHTNRGIDYLRILNIKRIEKI